jgi:hypothetical protein
MDPAAWAVVGVVALSLVALLALARSRAWNSDGSDDARRDEPRDESA